MNWGEFICNVLLISIPEELFLSIVAIALMRRVDFMDKVCWLNNLLKIFTIVVFPCSLFFNISLYLLGVNFNMPLNILFFTICLCILLKTKKFFKVLFFSIITMLIIMIIQMSMYAFILFILKLDMSQILGINPYVNFKLFLPERIIEFTIIAFILLRVNSARKINIFNKIIKNTLLRRITFFLAFIDLAFLLAMMKNIIIDNSLKDVLIINQIFIVTSMLSVIILNLIIPWIIIFCMNHSNSSENK